MSSGTFVSPRCDELHQRALSELGEAAPERFIASSAGKPVLCSGAKLSSRTASMPEVPANCYR